MEELEKYVEEFPPNSLKKEFPPNCQKGSTKRTLCGIVLFELNTFLVMFLQVPSIDSTCFWCM